MEMKQLHQGGFDALPQVFSIPVTLIGDTTNCGDPSQHTMEDAYIAADAKIRNARYSLTTNRCVVSVESQKGAVVQDFRLKVNVGFSEFKGKKMLHVKVVDTPHTVGKKHYYLTLQLDNGTTRVVRNAKKKLAVFNCVEAWLREHLPPLDSWDISRLHNKDVQQYLDPNNISQYYDADFKRRVIASRICFSLFESMSKAKLTLPGLMEAGLLTEYPQIDVPYKVLKRYDTKIQYQFVGLAQKGGNGGHTMNLQTAQRISRLLGESVSVEDMLSQLDNLASVSLGPMRLWVLGIANKITKRLS